MTREVQAAAFGVGADAANGPLPAGRHESYNLEQHQQ
jgi:hypothetical protein